MRRGVKAERPRERLGAHQVWLFELQPGDVDDLDHRISRPVGVVARQRSLLAVQVAVSVVRLSHDRLPSN